jgi:hypothetical protein
VPALSRTLLLALLLAVFALPGDASASSRQWMTFEAPAELLDDRRREAALDEIQGFGVDRIRVLVYWRRFAPDATSRVRPDFEAADHTSYPAGTWADLDRLLASARARGIHVQLTPTGPVPRWATRRKHDQVTRPSPREFQAWMTALGTRYRDAVDVWSIWNEPNHPEFLGPQHRRGEPASPRIYRRLYQAAQRALRSTGNGSDMVLFGETLPRGGSRTVNPIPFLRSALCLDRRYRKNPRCGRLQMDGYAHHAYTTTEGPRFKPGNRDHVTIGVLGRLTRALDRAARAGAVPARLGIYLTEFGIQSYPDRTSGVPLSRQAQYLAVAERMAYANPRVKAFSQYLLHDDARRADGSYGGFETGLRTAKGRKKPAYEGFRLPLAVAHYGRSDVLWGRVRPYPARTTVSILAARRGESFKPLRTVRTNARGVFGLRSRHIRGQRYRVRWVSPDGTTYTGPPIRPTRPR